MKTKKSFFFLLFIFIHTLINAQVVPYERYTSKNGLISDRITAITQDEKGFMWFGSFFGICRYNGIKFEKIALHPKQQNKYVTFLLPANNKMYAGFLFQGGLAEFNNGKINAHFINGKDSASANEFSCVTNNNDGSILLCNTSRQIYQFKNGGFTHLYTLKQKISAYPTSIVKDGYNNIWLGTENGLFILPYPYKSENYYFRNQNIFSLIKDESRKIWFSRVTPEKIITQTSDGRQHDKTLNQTTISTSSNLRIVSFSGSTAKGVWGIDITKGLVNIANKKSSFYAVPLDFTTDINAVFADRENNIWIANEPDVFKISNFDIQSYLFNEIAAGGGTLFMENDSSVWATNSKYLYRITHNVIQKKKVALNNPHYYGKLYVDTKKNLWIGLWNEGLLFTNWSYGKLISKKLFSEFSKKKIKAQTITDDSNGNIWVGGPNGVFRIKDNKIVETFQPVNESGNPAFITCISLDEKNKTIWMGDNALGVIKVKYEILSNNSFNYKVAGYINASHGLNDTYIRSIMADHKNNVWVGTRSGGIYQIKETDKNIKVINYTSEANLSCTRVTDIKQEDTSAIWFATCDGIYRFQHLTNQWTHYNTSDGLLNAEVFNISVDTKKGLVWALTSHGITKLQINTGKNPTPPLINITGINILGKADSAALWCALTGKRNTF